MSPSTMQESGSSPDRMDGEALLLFSFGPVQPFIAAARKTADLWTGSALLSRLAHRALAPVREACGSDAVIFPDLPDAGPEEAAGETVAAPNRFVAALPAEADAERLAQLAGASLQEAFQSLVTSALEDTGIMESYPRELGERQAGSFLDTYWCFLPLQDGVPYGKQYRRLERLLGARKATRDFDGDAAPGYRCDLIPNLSALVPAPESDPGAVRDYWTQKAEAQPAGRLREGEELSAVALAKRAAPDLPAADVAPEGEAFPSTSSLAAAGFKARVLRALPEHDALREAVGAYEAAMQPLLRDLGAAEAPLPKLQALAREHGIDQFHRISGEWLFEESFEPDRLERRGTPIPETRQREEALRALRSLRSEASAAGLGAPSRYYALLLLDGDRMGTWLSGEEAPIDGDIDTDYHRAVSRALGHFAEAMVPQVVENGHLGRVVYSGGDDVLAFLSLRDALPAARAVRAAFSGHLEPAAFGEEGPFGGDPNGAGSAGQDPVDWDRERSFTDDPAAETPTMGATASASAGLVFAHHMQPLDQVLSRARDAETAAKDDLGRDALACALMKRSGERLTAGGKWHRGERDLVKTLTGFADLVREGTVSTGFLHTVQREAETLSGLGDSAGMRAELRRIFARQGGGGAFDRTVGALLDLAEDREAPLRVATDLLEVAQFIATDGTS